MIRSKKNKPAAAISFLLLSCYLLITISACAPSREVKYRSLPTDLYASTSFDIKPDIEIQYTVNESEAVLEEELTALNKTGSWDDQQAKLPTPKQIEEVTFDFPIVINKQVEFYLNLFQNRQRNYFEKWLSRSSIYTPYILTELKDAGLPLDLTYLALIESGFNPSAYSKSHAAGLWQFIKSTGKEYGLRINSHVDERRNPEKATKAAIQYLADLYKEFDSWYLAVAAYNAGPGKVRRAIKKYQTRDFWKLASKKYLKLETKRYVPKLIAAILIAKEPEKYGFTDIEYQNPEQYDVITVPPMTDLKAVSMASGYSVKQLRKLNNELLKWHTPSGKKDYELRIPYGSKAQVAMNLSRLHPVVTTDYKTHVVRKGDTLTAICRRYNLNKTTLLKANNLHSAKLSDGQRLRIPYQSTKYVLLKEGETPQTRFAKAENGGELFLHVVKSGETLSRISKQYNVNPEIIMQWNNLESIHRIKANQTLALYLESPVMAEATVVSYDETNLTSIEELGASNITYYKVKRGDSLWTIAKKFQVSPQKLKKWNNLKSNLIHPGKRLVIWGV